MLAEFGKEGEDPPLSLAPGSVWHGGRAYILQPQAGNVALVDPQTREVQRVGHPGSGPGEFLRPSSLGVYGDTLWVFDQLRGRSILFSPDGELLDEIPGGDPPTFGRGVYSGSGEVLADGSQLLRPVGSAWVNEDGSLPSVALLRRPDPRSAPVPLVWLPEAPADRLRIPHPQGTEVAVMTARRLVSYTPLVRRLPTGDGLWVLEQHEAPRLVRVGLDGDTIVLAEPTLSAPAVPHEWIRARLVEWYPYRSDHPFNMPEGRFHEYILSHVGTPEWFPLAEHLVAAADGGVWLGQYSADMSTRGWYRFDEKGIQKGGIELPSDWSLHGARGDTIWGVREGEWGEPIWFLARVDLD